MNPAISLAADRRSIGQLVALLVVFASSVIALMAYLIWSGYREAIREAEIKTRNYAAIIETRLDATLRRTDAILQERVRTLPVAALSQQAISRYAREIDALLDADLTNFQELTGLRIFDAAGDQLYSSDREKIPRTHIGDRDYFRRLRDDRQASLVFSEVITSRGTGRQSVTAVRALRDHQGIFRGVVLAGINLQYYQKLFESLDLGAQSVVSIYRSDNFTPVVRWPVVEGKVDTPLPPDHPARAALAPGVKTATMQFSSSTDSIVRIYSMHVLDRYPFFVNVGVGRGDVLTSWKERSLAVGLAGLLLLGLLVGLLLRLWRAQTREALVMAELVEGESRYRSVVSALAEGIVLNAKDGSIIASNESAERILGLTADQMMGRTPLDPRWRAVHEDGTPFPGETHPGSVTLRTGRPQSNVIMGVHKPDGTLSWISINSQPIFQPGEQQPSAVVASFADVTERKEALTALQSSEAWFRSIFENVNTGIASTDASGMVTSFNEAFRAMLGYNAASLRRMNFADFTHPDDLKLENVFFNEILAHQREHYRITKRYIASDGRTVWVDLSANVVRDVRGEVANFVAVVQDVTERKQAEVELRLAAGVFDTALDGIFITDKDYKIVAVNRAFTAITGYSTAEAIGQTPLLLRSNYHDEAFHEAMRRAIRETGTWQGEIWDRRKSGELYCELLSISAVRDERGGITNYCAVFADITSRKVAEAELTDLNVKLEERVAARTQELERANRELDAFSYSVAHDLRAPLRAINGFCSILADANRDKLDAESIGDLARIQTAVQHMARLIDDLLDLARVSREEMHRIDFNLSALADQAAESFVQAHPERTVHVTVQPDMHAHGDPKLVRIALDNLLGNAWKFTARTAEARIEVGNNEREGETVFFVRDNGAGFDMQYADRLFGAFQRLHGQQEFEGTGIGLSIVQRIFVRHGGRVWAEGAVGQGATIYFTFGAH